MLLKRAALFTLLTAALFAAPAARAEFPGFAELKTRAAKAWTGENPARGAYLVLLPAKSPLEPAAKALAAHRKAEIVAYDPARPEDLMETLIRKKARWAAVFAEPKDMDLNLVRRFIVISTLLDDDPFCDMAVGFVTGSTPKKAEAFVARMIAADRAGVKPFAIQMSVSNLSQRYEGSTFIPGVAGESWYMNMGDLSFARKAIAELPRAGFVHIGSCADPEGIWMFDDDRNRHSELHWPYDPKRVGEDPKGEMPRIKAEEFRGLDLGGAVVWTHSCHLGSVDRVFVEGDIVSTFGTTQKLEAYRIPPGRSVALAILDAGPSAYIAPLGPNHGSQASLEHALAGELGLPLGDVMRRSWHDVVMDTGGRPEMIGVYVPGAAVHSRIDGFVNNNSPHNRCLYGDPLFSPLKHKPSPPTVEIWADEKADCVALTFRVTGSELINRTWYSNRGHEFPGRGRIYEVVPLKKTPAAVSFAEIRTRDASGNPFPICSRTALIERIDGKTFLHVQIVSDVEGALSKAGASIEAIVKFHAQTTRETPPETPPAPSAGETGSPVDRALAAVLGINKREWNVEEFCTYVEKFLRARGGKPDTGMLAFVFEDDAQDALPANVVLDLSGKTLLNAVEDLCRQLGLRYAVDRTENAVRFSRSKGEAPGKAGDEGKKPAGEDGKPPAPPAEEPAKPAAGGAPIEAIPSGQPEDAYVIMTDIPVADPWFQVAAKLTEVHPEAQLLTFPSGNPEAVEGALCAMHPRFVALVLKPATIDVNFQGRFLQLCARMDDDPFPDFSYGYLTGATAEEAVRFAENIGKAWKTKRPKKILEAATWGGATERTESPSSPELGVDWPMTTLHFGQSGNQPMNEEQAKAYLRENLADWKGNGAILMGGHGSPREIHGNISGRALRAVLADLSPAFVYNFACLTGCTSRAFEWIENQEELATVKGKTVDPAESMALAVIASGASGYVASIEPRPAGPGMSAELRWALTSGDTVGETRRREYAMLALAFLDWGEKGLVVNSYKDGEPRKPRMNAVRDIMMMNASGTILFGDPAMQLAPKSADPVATRWKPDTNGFLLEAEFAVNAGTLAFDPYRTWGSDGYLASKIYAVADLPAGLASIGFVEAISVQAQGSAVSFDHLTWAVERIGDRKRLHVKVNVPPDAVDAPGSRAVFRVLPAGAAASPGSKAPAQPPAPEDPSSGDDDSPADRALACAWFLPRQEWVLDSFLQFVEGYLREHGDPQTSGKLVFIVDDDAKYALQAKVTIEMESKPLKTAVEAVCRQLSLKYSIDRKANAVRFSRSKGITPGQGKQEGEENKPSEPGSEPQKPSAPAKPQEETTTGEPDWRVAPLPDTPETTRQIQQIMDAIRGAAANPVERLKHIQRLGLLRSPGALRSLRTLYAEDKDFLPRFYAVLGAADVDGKEAAQFLLEALLSEKEPYVQRGVRDSLRRLRTREAAEALVTALRHQDPVARSEAATALGGLRWAGAVAPLVQALQDPQQAPRIAAIEALGRLCTSEAVDALLKIASGTDSESAMAALGALGDSPSKDARIGEAAATLIEKGRHFPLRILAAKTLGIRKDAAGLKALIAGLEHSDMRLRSAAVGALGKIRHRDAIGALIARIPKEQGRLQWEVGQALYRITGLDYGTDQEIWNDWWGKNKDTFQPPPMLQVERKQSKELTEASYHGIPIVSRRIIFILDVSSSMTAKIRMRAVPTGRKGAPKGDTRLDYCKWELAHVIRTLPKDARFNVLVFGDNVKAWQKQIVPAVPAWKAEAEKFVDGVNVQGSTNLFDSLKGAFEDLEADTFYILSDGDPTAGQITDKDEILRWVRRMNASRGVAIHTISAGDQVSEDFLQKLAEQNGGKSVVMK